MAQERIGPVASFIRGRPAAGLRSHRWGLLPSLASNAGILEEQALPSAVKSADSEDGTATRQIYTTPTAAGHEVFGDDADEWTRIRRPTRCEFLNSDFVELSRRNKSSIIACCASSLRCVQELVEQHRVHWS